ncbi:MAG TPA: hypothetical protein VIJ66_06440 [Solirubrobacteraceae bacterium]
MPIATREAEIIWDGPLASGSGTLSSASGALASLPVTWAARTEQLDGKTSGQRALWTVAPALARPRGTHDSCEIKGRAGNGGRCW